MAVPFHRSAGKENFMPFIILHGNGALGKFPDAAHDLLRFRTGAVLDMEAGRVAASRVADSSLHPQNLFARVLAGYLVLVRAAERPAFRRGVAALVGALTLVLLRRVLVRRARE